MERAATPLALAPRRLRAAFATARSESAVVLLVAGSLALLVEPALWLARTWVDPTWDSDGAWAAAACVLLLARSMRSGPAAPAPQADRRSARLALGLVLATAAVRIVGRVLAIRVVGALALAVDVAAVGVALRLSRRPWPLHPAALAGLFAFALPLEPLLQRVLGYPLRLVSTVVAHAALTPFADGLTRAGTLLVTDGQALAIDLPCSGARGLTLLAALAAAVACRRRPGVVGAAAGALAVAAGALAANTVRIVAVYAGLRAGLPVLAEPWHGLLGLVGLALGAAPLLVVATRWPIRTAPAAVVAPAARTTDDAPGGFPAARTVPRETPARVATAPRVAAALLVGAAAALLLVPERPLDVSGAVAPVRLPQTLGPWRGAAVPLEPTERRYFERFGGRVAKATYGDGVGPAHQVVVVRTTSPVRHLHAPDRCLAGAGHTVERVGVRPGGVPTVVWRSRDPDGALWRVEASFLGPRGETAATVSEVAWRWLRAPGGAWTLVERITPWDACPADPSGCARFEAALLAALDVPTDTTTQAQEVSP